MVCVRVVLEERRRVGADTPSHTGSFALLEVPGGQVTYL